METDGHWGWWQLASANRCCWVLDKPGSQIAEQCSSHRDCCDIELGHFWGVTLEETGCLLGGKAGHQPLQSVRKGKLQGLTW